jgi:hypothetical protein
MLILLGVIHVGRSMKSTGENAEQKKGIRMYMSDKKSRLSFTCKVRAEDQKVQEDASRETLIEAERFSVGE